MSCTGKISRNKRQGEVDDVQSIREQIEEVEKNTLSPYAQLVVNTRGRAQEQEKCDFRTEYQRDRDRILHSKSFRRLKHKTQVFIAPQGDHYRTRLTHTLEVSQIARTIARALRLNEDLTEAMSLGHDLGHTPFGHRGEDTLDALCSGGFRHYEQSLRVVDVLEDGHGLNLTYEVRDGIRNHTGKSLPSTLEGKVLKFADKFAYINHDIDDAIRGGVLSEEELPKDLIEILGARHSQRINTLISDTVRNSLNKNDIVMSDEVGGAMMKLRDFMFAVVYENPTKREEERKGSYIIEEMFKYFMKKPELLPDEYKQFMGEYPVDRVVCDYIAGMSDGYAVHMFSKIFVPGSWTVF